EDYDASVNLLNLTLLVDFKVNAGRDRKILKEEIKDFQQLQATLTKSMNQKDADTNKMVKNGKEIVETSDNDPFARFVPFIKDVAEILNKTVDLRNMVEHNKKITKNLIERIAKAFSMLSIIREDDLYTSTHDVKLQELVQVLQNMKSFIEVITQCNTSQKFLGTKTKTIEKGFKDLCKEYNNIISLLKFDDLKKN